MTIEGNVGADASLLLSAADGASANARAAQGTGGAPVAVTAAPPQGAHYAAPSSLLMAAAPFVVPASGLFLVSFDFYFTDSAPDTVTVSPTQQIAVTSVSGGTQQGGWFIDEGAAVVVVGGSSAAVENLSKTVTTGALESSINASFVSQATPGTTIAIKLVLTAAHTLSAMTLNAAIFPLG